MYLAVHTEDISREECDNDVESNVWETYKRAPNEHDDDPLERAHDNTVIILTFVCSCLTLERQNAAQIL